MAFFFFQRSIWYIPLLKSVLNLLQYCFCFYALVFWPLGMWNLSSLTRDQTCTPCIGRQSLNHWTATEVPQSPFRASAKQNSLWYGLIPLPTGIAIFLPSHFGLREIRAPDPWAQSMSFSYSHSCQVSLLPWVHLQIWKRSPASSGVVTFLTSFPEYHLPITYDKLQV